MMKYGIDFGTTNSVVSFNNGKTVSVLPIDPLNDVTEIMPSTWFFDYDEEDWFFGQQAYRTYLENFGEGRLIQSLKRHLANSHLTNTFVKTNDTIKLEKLVEIFLTNLKTKADGLVGQDVKDVVIGKPVNFSETGKNEVALDRIRHGAMQAGFENVDFMFEPLAATYSLDLVKKRAVNIITVDIGGGTTDISVVRSNPGSIDIGEVLATGGISFGGVDFDAKIMRHKLLGYFGEGLEYDETKGVNGTFPRPLLFPLTDRYKIFTLINNLKYLGDIRTQSYGIIDPQKKIESLNYLIKEQKGFELFDAIERAKKELSYTNEACIEYKSGPIAIKEKITRSEFEEYICEYVSKTKELILDSLIRANVERDQIDVVSLAGGSSRVPIFSEMVSELFPEAEIVQMNIMTSIASGLGMVSSPESLGHS